MPGSSSSPPEMSETCAEEFERAADRLCSVRRRRKAVRIIYDRMQARILGVEIFLLANVCIYCRYV